MNEAMMITVIRHALRALSERVLTVLALLMTFGLSAWVMYRPSWEREGMAAFFAIAVFLPCVWRDRRSLRNEVPQAQAQDPAQAG